MAEIRKIMSTEELEKKSQKNKVIMSVVLAVIMLFSTAGYFVFDFTSTNEAGSSSKIEYNGVEFSKTDYETWKFSYGGNSYETLYNPNETSNVSVEAGFSKKISDYYGNVLYFSAEPIESLSAGGSQEILRNLENLISRTNYACLADDLNCTLEQDYPVKNCSVDNVIVFKAAEGNNSVISQNEKCAVITYALGDDEKAADAFLFGMMGIK